MLFHQRAKMQGHELVEGYTGRFVHGEAITVAHWDVVAGNRIPSHAHHHEQIVNCLEGTFDMTVGEETFRMTAGDTVIVPPDVEHSALAVTDCRCLDVFTPVRDDYRL
jgi:quercetin dioxygenase-like cupin family protein